MKGQSASFKEVFQHSVYLSVVNSLTLVYMLASGLGFVCKNVNFGITEVLPLAAFLLNQENMNWCQLTLHIWPSAGAAL